MKIKFSKVMAIVCAVSVAFAGLTAFAAVGDVTVTTTYDAYSDNTTAPVTVDATIYGEEGKEVTYYVADGSEIVYINQGTVSGGKVEFTFSSTHAAALNAVAKFGTDAATNSFPTFKFTEATNYLTQGTANATVIGYVSETYIPYDENGNAGTETTGDVFKAKVSGAATEYGIMIGDNLYPAAGCSDDGTYMVIINGKVSVAGKTVYAYAKDASGNVVPSASAFTIQ